MRSSVVDWLVQVQQYLSPSDTTLPLAVANFDLIISLLDWDTEEIQLFGLACFQLAAKVEEDCGLVVSTPSRRGLEVIRALDLSLRNTARAVFLHYYR